MWYTSWRQYNCTWPSSRFFIADSKDTAPAEYHVKLVSTGMSVNWLHLIRFETVQSNHHVFALPERCLEELVRINPFEIMPVKEVRHCHILMVTSDQP